MNETVSSAHNEPNASAPAAAPSGPPIDLLARRLLRSGLAASLATIDAEGAPYASFVGYATRLDGTPIFLFSGLSPHTRNLARDPRFALLISEPPKEKGDPMNSARISLSGRMERSDAPADRARYLRRHDAFYAGLADFKIHVGVLDQAHIVAGFGRAQGLPLKSLLIDIAGADALAEAEEGVVTHMNGDHGDANRLYATKLLGQPEGDWRMTGLDPEGCDLRAENRTARLEFPRRIANAGEARDVLVALVKQARAG